MKLFRIVYFFSLLYLLKHIIDQQLFSKIVHHFIKTRSIFRTSVTIRDGFPFKISDKKMKGNKCKQTKTRCTLKVTLKYKEKINKTHLKFFLKISQTCSIKTCFNVKHAYTTFLNNELDIVYVYKYKQ